MPTVTVEQFYKSHAEALELRLIGGSAGLKRKIREGTVNRPGLAFVGYYKYFADKRIQVIGSAETNYLHSLSQNLLRRRIRSFFRRNIPCVIFSRCLNPPRYFRGGSGKVRRSCLQIPNGDHAPGQSCHHFPGTRLRPNHE